MNRFLLTVSLVSALALPSVASASPEYVTQSKKFPCKLLQPADRPMAGSSSLEGHFGTGLHARFSSAWSTAGCGRNRSESCTIVASVLYKRK